MVYRLSKYNYFIEYENKVICYNGLNDKLFVLNQREFNDFMQLFLKLLDFKKKYPSLFNKLRKWGFIVRNDSDETNDYLEKYKETIYNPKVYSVTINPTLKCNLGCWYCSVGLANAQIKYNKMSAETLGRIKKHFKNVIEYNAYSLVHIDWFGGEPLLYYDEIIKPIASYVYELTLKHSISFTQFVTTNAFLINKSMLNEFKKFNLQYFQITIDGNEKKHNKVRNEEGKPTYKKIIQNIVDISNIIPNVKIYLRINYDKKTLLKISDILEDLQNSKKDRITIDFQKVWQVPAIESSILKEAIMLFKKDGFKVRLYAFRPFQYFSCQFDKKNHIVINYDGTIHKCTARDYSDKSKVGDISSSGEIVFNDKINAYYNKLPIENEFCKECKHLPICCGPCTQKMYEKRQWKSDFNKICLVKNSPIKPDTFIIEKARDLGYLSV